MCKQLKSLDSTDMHLLSCDSDIVSQLYHQQLPALYGRFHCTVFRGQRNHAWGLIPTCMRDGMDTDEVSNIIRRTRANMLQEMIVSTEFYKANYTVNIKISSEHLYTIYSDPWILAQHYGLSTPLIDYTSDPLVAMFFACTKFSENGWEPLTSTDIELSPYGRIFLDEYRMNPHSASSPNVISPTLSSRPMNQKGFLIRHPRFADSSIVFEHDPIDGLIKPLYAQLDDRERDILYREADQAAQSEHHDLPDVLVFHEEFLHGVDVAFDLCRSVIHRNFPPNAYIIHPRARIGNSAHGRKANFTRMTAQGSFSMRERETS